MLQQRANISDFDFAPSGHEIALSSTAGVELWELTGFARTRILTNYIGLLYSPRSPTWWLKSDFRSAGLHRADTLEPLLPLPTGTMPLAVSRDGRLLAASVDGRALQLWDLDEVHRQMKSLGLDFDEFSAGPHSRR